MNIDYGKSFTYIFEDEEWVKKFLIGMVVSLIPIVNFAAYGYMVELLKRVRDGIKEPLPDWDYFGQLFFDGLKVCAGAFVYYLPVVFLGFLTIPLGILGGDDPGALFNLTMFFVMCLVFFFSFAPMFILPAAVVQYAKRDDIKDMFALSEIWEMIRADLGTYIIILLLFAVVLSFIAGLGFIACFIGVFFTSWYAYLVTSHMLGQYARQLPGAEKTI